MDASVLVAIVSAVEGIGIAIIGFIVSGINRKNEQYRLLREQRESLEKQEREQKERELAEFRAAELDLVFATANGTDVLLQSAHGEHINGNVDEARKSIQKAKSECNHIVNKQAVMRIGGNK